MSSYLCPSPPVSPAVGRPPLSGVYAQGPVQNKVFSQQQNPPIQLIPVVTLIHGAWSL